MAVGPLLEGLLDPLREGPRIGADEAEVPGMEPQDVGAGQRAPGVRGVGLGGGHDGGDGGVVEVGRAGRAARARCARPGWADGTAIVDGRRRSREPRKPVTAPASSATNSNTIEG